MKKRCEKCGESIDNSIDSLAGTLHRDKDGEFWLCWVCEIEGQHDSVGQGLTGWTEID